MPHVVFGLCFSCPHFLCLFVCVCLSLLLSAPVMFCSLVCSLFVLLFLFFVCCSCSLFVVLVLCLFFVCCFCSFVCSSILCLLFLFFVLTVWWFVLFPKRLRVGIQRQWGKNTCEDCQKDWLYWPILGGYRFFLPYRVGGLGKRGGMVLLHVNDPPFFTTPSENMPKQPSSRGISIMSSESR